MKYAEQTTVSSERSRAEIETILKAYRIGKMPPMFPMLNGGERVEK